MRALALVCLLLAGAALGARAEGIWTALVLGTNEQPAKPAPKALSPYAKGLETVFGANTVYLLAARLQAIEKAARSGLCPRNRSS